MLIKVQTQDMTSEVEWVKSGNPSKSNKCYYFMIDNLRFLIFIFLKNEKRDTNFFECGTWWIENEKLRKKNKYKSIKRNVAKTIIEKNQLKTKETSTRFISFESMNESNI